MRNTSMMSWRKSTDLDPRVAQLRALMLLRMLPLSDPRLSTLLQQHDATQLIDHPELLGGKAAAASFSDRLRERCTRALESALRLDVQTFTIADVDYPPALLRLGEFAPPVLFMRGRVELLRTRTIAVIGARHSTEYGDQVAELLATELARRDITIASGLALGIDSIAHRSALAVGANTIAVLGCGIDVSYPPRHAALQERIAEEGLLISEFAPGDPAYARNFPQRNRIIALISNAVLVIEAGPRSGTLKTVDWALGHNVDVYAVPGPIGRIESQGTNEMIRDGAHIVTDVRDILEPLGWSTKEITPETSSDDVAAEITDPNERAVFAMLETVARHVDQIARRCGRSTMETLALLTELELSGYVLQHPGKRFSRRIIEAKKATVTPQRGSTMP